MRKLEQRSEKILRLQRSIDFTRKTSNMKELLTLIIVADWLANDLHYRSSGSGFYEKHLLADKIRNVGSIDELKESYFLGFKTCLPPLDVGLAKSATFVYEKICSQCNGELQRLELVFT